MPFQKLNSYRNLPMPQTSLRKLDLIGIGLLAILALGAWELCHPFTTASLFPLLLVAYAAFRIIFELTWNRHNVPTIATGFWGRRKMAQIIRNSISSSRISAQAGTNQPFQIVDLGSGRGELSRYLARALPDCLVTGIELAKIPHAQATFIQRWLGPKNVRFLCQNFDDYTCGTADAVVMYLSGNLTQQVGKKLKREMKKGGLIISHTFPLGGDWQPAQILDFRTPFKERLYIYHCQ